MDIFFTFDVFCEKLLNMRRSYDTIWNMSTKREQWSYGDAGIWFGRYRNSHNNPHWHYECELLYIDKGSLSIHCNGHDFLLREGDAFFIDSEQVHYMHACSHDTELTLIVFSHDMISRFISGKTLACSKLTSNYGIPKLYSVLKRELDEKQPFYAYRIALVTAQLVTDIFRNEPLVSNDKDNKALHRFKALLNDLESSYPDCTLDSAARFMCMNPSYFSRLFHKMTGMTFSSYLNYIKCKNAVAMLKSGSDVTVTEISIKCGFTTIRNFNRIFKKYTGYSPSQLPDDFLMPESIPALDDDADNPTDVGSVLIESSDDKTRGSRIIPPPSQTQ